MEENTRTNIDDFLTVRGFGGYGGYGGYGGGGGGYGHGGSGYFASPGANAVRINRNAELINRGEDSIRDLFNFNNINDKFATLQAAITGHAFNALRENADLSRQLADCCCDNKVATAELKAVLLKEIGDCCCETQKLVISENSRTREEFQKSILETANARITQLETINAINASDGGHRRP